jgi:LytS/YehU family sensor histidine kinase
VPAWIPYALAAIVTAIAGAATTFGLYGWSASPSIPPRQLVISLANSFVLYAIPFTLVALGYMRGLDAWRRANTLRTMQLERTRLSRKAYESRLQALQARVDPRFLFETLAAIETTYEADAAHGERMIDDLIAYLRAALPTLEGATSSLDAETSLVRAWLDLMRMRHGERLSFSIALPDAERETRMPPMVLQPLVQHAVDAIVNGAFDMPHVAIVIGAADGRLHVALTTTGPAFAEGAHTPALLAVSERLAVLYGDSAALQFRWVNRNESRAALEIPHEPTDRDHR